MSALGLIYSHNLRALDEGYSAKLCFSIALQQVLHWSAHNRDCKQVSWSECMPIVVQPIGADLGLFGRCLLELFIASWLQFVCLYLAPSVGGVVLGNFAADLHLQEGNLLCVCV